MNIFNSCIYIFLLYVFIFCGLWATFWCLLFSELRVFPLPFIWFCFCLHHVLSLKLRRYDTLTSKLNNVGLRLLFKCQHNSIAFVISGWTNILILARKWIFRQYNPSRAIAMNNEINHRTEKKFESYFHGT